MLHMQIITERNEFWEYCKQRGELAGFLDHLLEEYVQLYEKNDRGSDRYARFFLAWHSLAEKYCSYRIAGTTTQNWWDKLAHDHTATVSDDTRNTVVTTLLYSTFNCMQHEVTRVLESLNVTDRVTDTIQADDDVSLMRLGGWALFSAKKYRERALKHETKTKLTASKLQVYQKEIKVLESVVMSNKSELPIGIAAKDRGKLTLPHPSLVPFLRKANTAFKESLNHQCYQKYGPKLMEVNR